MVLPCVPEIQIVSSKAFVIRPKKPVNIGRTEKNREKLEALYNDGYNDAKDCYEELLKYLGKW